MANRQNLGEALGMMLSGGLDKSKRNQGYEDGVKAQLGLSNIDLNTANIGKANAETALKTQQFDNGTDDSIIKNLLSGIGANSADGLNDFKSAMAGNYKPLVGAPTQQQAQQGNSALPQPAYVNKFPDLLQKYAGLKQMIVLNDTNYNNLSQGLHGDQLNQLTNNITPQNAVDVANNVAAFNGKPDDVLKAQLINRIANDGKPNSDERASLYLGGKTDFTNMGNDGTLNTVTGEQSINPIGHSVINKNNAKEDNNGDISLNELTPEARAMVAERYRTDGTMPSLGMGKSSKPLRIGILNDAAASDAKDGITGAQARGLQLETKGNQGAYNQITKDITAIKPYKVMLDTNAKIAIDLAGKVLKTNSALANKTITWLEQNASDNPDVAEFMAQNHFVSTEAARVLSNPRLVGQMPESAVKDMQAVVNGNAPLGAYTRVMQRIMKDGDNRTIAMENERNDLHKKLSRDNSPASNQQAPASTNANPLSVTAPNGKTYSFKDAASLSAFKMKAGLK